MGFEEKIKVTVLLPVYNAEKYLNEAIESILVQSYTDFELLIINDGSTDGTSEIISYFKNKDKRLRIIDNGQNKGLIYSLNLGLLEAKGEYIARMDADDISLPERLMLQVAYLDTHPSCAVVGSNYEMFGRESGLSKLWTDPEVIKVCLLFECPIAHPSVIIRKRILLENKIEYRKELLHLEDWGLWFDTINFGEIHNMSETLLKYRIEGQNISLNNSETAEYRIKKLYKILLGEMFDEITEKEINCFWTISRTVYIGQPLFEISTMFNILRKKLREKEFLEKNITIYLNSKKVSFYYAIINKSRVKAFRFMLKERIFSFSRFTYLVKLIIKPSVEK